jgi:hypothetical protein
MDSTARDQKKRLRRDFPAEWEDQELSGTYQDSLVSKGGNEPSWIEQRDNRLLERSL